MPIANLATGLPAFVGQVGLSRLKTIQFKNRFIKNINVVVAHFDKTKKL